MNRIQIIESLKTILPSAKLPSNIRVEVVGDVLNIKLGHKGVVANMQTDESAFEGWAIVLKAAIKSIKTVSLDWEAPQFDENKKNAQQAHYNRFLMRIANFMKAYNWLMVAKAHIHEIEEMQAILDNKSIVVNYPQRECSPVSQAGKKSEAVLERKLVEQWSINCPITDEQLPVGLFEKVVSKDTSLTPRGASQIDLWQLDGKTMKIYELKVRGNESVGIISELMFYVYTIKNIIDGFIRYPDVDRVNNYRHFKDFANAVSQHKVDKVIGFFTTPHLHSLIEALKKDIQEILNDNVLGVEFGYHQIDE